jgi:hypothetical protein
MGALSPRHLIILLELLVFLDFLPHVLNSEQTTGEQPAQGLVLAETLFGTGGLLGTGCWGLGAHL